MSEKIQKRSLREYAIKLGLLKGKFALVSLVATAIDYGLYLVLVSWFFSPVLSNVLSYSFAVVVNFFMQKRFVFKLKRSASRAFVFSMLVSLGGLVLSTAIIYLLSRESFFFERQYITKFIATGIVFFYNFYMKRYVFERRFFEVD